LCLSLTFFFSSLPTCSCFGCRFATAAAIAAAIAGWVLSSSSFPLLLFKFLGSQDFGALIFKKKGKRKNKKTFFRCGKQVKTLWLPVRGELTGGVEDPTADSVSLSLSLSLVVVCL
jgi:hypothetical protein